MQLNRSALYVGIIAATLLAGSGGSQPPGAIAQTSVIAAQGERGESWMLPEAKNEALLYTSTEKGVYITSYPRGKLVGTLAVASGGALF
jgi:hypothetical protein